MIRVQCVKYAAIYLVICVCVRENVLGESLLQDFC